MGTRPLSLYIHWPFCLVKCPYCDFNSHVTTAPIDHGKWLNALHREMETLNLSVKDAHLGSIFFGGGTPSLMSPQTVKHLIAAAKKLWPCAPDMEITLEANPTSAESKRFHAFANAGVNRLSLGIQALNNKDLKRLGRRHNVDEALAALNMGRQAFERISFDLIYARQGQSLKDWEAELTRALDLSKGHLSLYQLSIEPGTPFFDARAKDKLKLPGSDICREFYDLTQMLCERAGLPAYEISNHARKGQESRHNLSYWRSDDYLGLGPGAHSRLQARALANLRDPETWLDQVWVQGHGLESDILLSPLERAEEFLLMGLRLGEGLDLKRLNKRTGYRIGPPAISELVDGGWLALKSEKTCQSHAEHRLVVTSEGRPVLNTLINILAASLRKCTS